MYNWREKITSLRSFLTNRILILILAVVLIFSVLVSSLFEAQIVDGHFSVPVAQTSTRYITLSAPRGEIFDTFGRPLAINQAVFTAKLDSTQASANPNDGFIAFINLMAQHGEEIFVDSEFLVSAYEPRVFSDSPAVHRRWLRDFHLDENLTASEAYDALTARFAIPEYLNSDDAHTLMLLRAALHLHSFNQGQVTLAWDISERTVMAIEENGRNMPGIYVDQDFLRIYPEGRYTSHIVGWLGRITEAAFLANRDYGYTPTCLFGRDGIELAFERYLRGTPGYTKIEVNAARRRVGTISHQPPIPGNNIFLTIDAHLQREVYYILEDMLADILLGRLNGVRGAAEREFVLEILESMVRSNNLSMRQIMDADVDSAPASTILQGFILSNDELQYAANFQVAASAFIADGISSGQVHVHTVFDIFAEQGIISLSHEERQRLRANQLAPAAILRDRISTREITPQMVNIAPATAAAMVLCVNTGGVLAAVNYPAFDANQLVNNFNNTYWAQLLNDPTRPMINRAFHETHAPGSTFKMVTGIAAMDLGIVSPHTRIFDGGIFRAAGFPYLRCWIHPGSHGSINMREAVAVSCNFFFNQIAFDMGNSQQGTLIQGINNLNYYMMAFGMGVPTGIEISEMTATIPGGYPRIPSPAFNAHLGRGPWTGGHMNNASIGQGDNDFTTATMANFFAALANNGTRHQMHFLSRTATHDGIVTLFEPVVAYQLDLNPAHMESIHLGMFDAAFSPRGTGRGIFAGFPMTAGVKSGTSEADGQASHSTYGGFAPFEDPQIAVYVMIPFADNRHVRAPAGHVLRNIFAEYFRLNYQADSFRFDNSLTP